MSSLPNIASLTLGAPEDNEIEIFVDEVEQEQQQQPSTETPVSTTPHGSPALPIRELPVFRGDAGIQVPHQPRLTGADRGDLPPDLYVGEENRRQFMERASRRVRRDMGLVSSANNAAGAASTGVQMDMDAETESSSHFDETGLKEIGNLASWTVSSWKPGCGVEALRNEDTNLFWQSDGPQPHHLSIHFTRMVSILAIRIYLDFEADESYTPTKITLLGGTGYHDLIPFGSLEFAQPRGWIDVDLTGVGGYEEGTPVEEMTAAGGNVLRAFLVQIRVVENHQNGKDTHVRGVRIYGRDERAGRGGRGAAAGAGAASAGLSFDDLDYGDDDDDDDEGGGKPEGSTAAAAAAGKGKGKKAARDAVADAGFFMDPPDWLRDMELR